MRTQSSTSEMIEVICRDCGGDGYVWGSRCQQCGGAGEYMEEVPLPCCTWCEEPTDGNLARVIDWQENVDHICSKCLAEGSLDPDAYGSFRVIGEGVAA